MLGLEVLTKLLFYSLNWIRHLKRKMALINCGLRLLYKNAVIFMLHSFLALKQDPSICLSFGFFSFFTQWSTGTAKSTRWQVFVSCWLRLSLVFWSESADVFVSQSPREFDVSFSWTCSDLWFTICQNGQMSIVCTIPSRSPFPPSHAYSCIPLVSVFGIRLCN